MFLPGLGPMTLYHLGRQDPDCLKGSRNLSSREKSIHTGVICIIRNIPGTVGFFQTTRRYPFVFQLFIDSDANI
jgi:hypothetical protein